MVEQPSRFDELMQEIRAGSESAARELFEAYGEHIRRVVRHYLSRRMRTLFDSSDFQQDVWASFFALPLERIDFHSPAELARFLATMANHKIKDECRVRIGARKRDLTRETTLSVVGEEHPAVSRTNDATPSQLAVADECWERMMRGRPPQIRLMLRLLREGHSYQEIARQTGLHEKAIQRHLQQLRKGLGK